MLEWASGMCCCITDRLKLCDWPLVKLSSAEMPFSVFMLSLRKGVLISTAQELEDGLAHLLNHGVNG